MSVPIGGFLSVTLLIAGCTSATLCPDGSTPIPRSAEVEVECSVNADTSVDDCRILKETPAGQGFGELALASARQAKLRKLGNEEARVRFPMRFTSDEPPCPA